MTQEKPKEKQWIYTLDGESYRVNLLPPEAQQALKVLLTLDKEQKELNVRNAICRAATEQLNSILHNNLTEEALIGEIGDEDKKEEDKEEEESLPW